MLDNLESIIENGLLCTNLKNQLKISHKNIASQGIQERRSNTMVTGTTNIHDYVPFYFAKKTPMLLSCVRSKNIDQQAVIYFALSLEILEQDDNVRFTLRSANTNNMPSFYSNQNLEKLDDINWSIIESKTWIYPEDEKQQKMAELLIPQRITIDMIDHIIVWNKYIKKIIDEFFQKKDIAISVRIDQSFDHYYSINNLSFITGPYFLYCNVKKTIEEINNNSRLNPVQREKYKFGYMSDCSCSICEAISTVYDKCSSFLMTYNGDINLLEHLQAVHGNLSKYDEYRSLDEQAKRVVEISAQLHDVGKLKSRLNDKGIMNKADGDHPVKALHFLIEIFKDQTIFTADEIRMIVVLVAYHDLIGEISTKGRNKEQLTNLVEQKLITSEKEFNMLLALSYADIEEYAVFPPFGITHAGKITELRGDVLNKLKEIVND